MSLIQNLWRSFDYHWNEAIRFVLQKFTVLEDSEGREGQIAYSDGGVYVHNGTGWVPVGGGQKADTQVFDFSADASDTWVINHNLGKYVTVQTMNQDGDRVEGSVVWNDLNTVTVTFSEPVQGRAVIGYGTGSQTQYVYNFTDSDEWVVNHNLGQYVLVQTMNASGERIEGSVKWSEDMNAVTISFESPQSGTALVI